MLTVRTRLLCVVLATGLIFRCALAIADSPADDYLLDHNEDFGTLRNLARLWVDYELMPPPKEPLVADAQRRLEEIWLQASHAVKGVEAAWQQAFDSDPLLERALQAYNRCHELDWQFQVMRSELRRQHGFKGYRELARQGNDWVETEGDSWLDLEDESLIRLYLWWMSVVQNAEKLSGGDAVPMGDLPTSYYQWLKRVQPYADKVDDRELLNSERALEVFSAGLASEKLLRRAEHQQIDQRTQLPQGMRQCLRLESEGHFLYAIGDSYLQVHVPQHARIHKAEAKLQQLLDQAQAIRPDILVALHHANRRTLEKKMREQENMHKKLLLALRSQPTGDEAPNSLE